MSRKSFAAFMYSYLKINKIDTKDMPFDVAYKKYVELRKAKGIYSENLPTDEPFYGKEIETAIRDKFSTVRKKLEKFGKARTTVYTLNKIYFVEIDDDYNFTIIKEIDND